MFYINFQWFQLALCTHQVNHLATTKISPFFVAELSEREERIFKIINVNALGPSKIDQNRSFKIPLKLEKNSGVKQQGEETEM